MLLEGCVMEGYNHNLITIAIVCIVLWAFLMAVNDY
jgi:hypothetical protein